MEYIGKINRKIYHSITDVIVTDEVVLSDTQIRHIQDHHPNDYEQYKQFLIQIVETPDYVIEANRPNSALLLKEFVIAELRFKLVLRLQTPNDPKEFKNSVITFMRINEKEWSRLIRNKKVLYRRENY